MKNPYCKGDKNVNDECQQYKKITKFIIVIKNILVYF